ncbi:hypothetical protein P8452_73576 [Trifolium repens]|nr:hypothetical protein P8452_73576 [Trifolium repens]
MSIDVSKSYKPGKDFVKDDKESLVDLNLTENTELWLLNLPLSKDLLADINGQELSLKLHMNGALASFEGASGKTYDFVSHASMEPEETVFISSATESKIAGKISRRVSVVHYPDPKELEKISSADTKQVYNNMARTTSYFPMKSGLVRNSHASASKSSRPKNSLSELPEQPSTSKGNRDVNKSNNRSAREVSRGHSSGVSAVSSEHSHGGKSKKRKQTE